MTKDGPFEHTFGEVIKVDSSREGEGRDIMVRLISGPKAGQVRAYSSHEIKRTGTAKNLKRALSWRRGSVPASGARP